ncbi:MAG: transporter substrate-binding domain-containing protein, partial [Candidatus Magnetoovum sp. WYHC-5]|nr:transporter substrate-binding domain-containing protein [Candidatus Magnetoovum sp. WYHC-5]
GSAKGILVDYWYTWAKINNYQVSFLAEKSDFTIDAVDKAKAHIIAGVTNAVDKDKRLDLSVPITELSLKLYALKDLNIISPGEPQEIEVGIVDDEKTLKVLKGLYPLAKFKLFKSYIKLFDSIYNNDVKAFISEKNTALYYLNRMNIKDKFKEIKSTAYIEIYAAVKKGNSELLKVINSGIDKIDEQKVDSIINHWHGTQSGGLGFNFYDAIDLTHIVIVVLLVLISVLLLILKRKSAIAKNSKSKLMQNIETLRQEESLRRYIENNYKLLIDQSLTGFFIIQDRSFQYVNQRFLSIFDYDYDEAVSLSSYKAVFPDIDIDTIENTLFDTQSNNIGNNVLWYNCSAICKDGRTIVAETMWFRTLFDGTNAILGSILDISDYSKTEGQIKSALKEKVAALRELKDKNYELEVLKKDYEQQVRDEIERRISTQEFAMHQMDMNFFMQILELMLSQWNQPLHLIELTVKLIADSFEANKLDKYLMQDAINKNMECVSYITDGIKNILECFKPSMKKWHFDVVDTIKSSISMLNYTLEKNDIAIQTEFEGCNENGQLVINGYSNEFKQSIIAILKNACNAIILRRHDDDTFKETKGNLHIATNSSNELVQITIKDNGGTIPANLLSVMFDFQLKTKDHPRVTPYLYAVKMLIEGNMGGKLSAYNKDTGLMFIIELKQA